MDIGQGKDGRKPGRTQLMAGTDSSGCRMQHGPPRLHGHPGGPDYCSDVDFARPLQALLTIIQTPSTFVSEM